jgi:hypothetical protein
MGFGEIAIKFVVVGVLFLSVMSWITITQLENNPANLITNNTLINQSFGDLAVQLGGTQSQSKIAAGTFNNVTPTSNLGFVSVTSIVSPTRIFSGIILGTYTILIALPAQFLGVPDVVIAVINAILTLMIILAVWFVWKGVNT